MKQLFVIFSVLTLAACATTHNANDTSNNNARIPSSAQNTITEENAVLSFCPEHVMDCGGASIQFENGKGYRAGGATKEIQEELENAEGAYKFHHMTKSAPFTVTGYVKKVKNNAPFGPRGEVEFFFITDGLGSLRLPK